MPTKPFSILSDMLGKISSRGRLQWTELTPAEWRDADDPGLGTAEGG